MAENEELVLVDDVIVPSEDTTQTFNISIALPTYDDTTDKSVMSSLRDIYKGFSFDANEDFGSRFKDLEQVADYVSASIDDINNRQRTAEATSLLQKAASCARLWCMSVVIDKVLSASKYGTKAAETLAAQLTVATSYVYRMRSVAKGLSLTDCYLLGVRGITPTMLIHIGELPDDAIRKGLVTSFVNSITDTADVQACARARRALVVAMNANKHANAAAITTSDPAAVGGSDILVNESYQTAMETMHKWRVRLKKVAAEQEIEGFCAALADFSINETVPEAERHLEEVKTEATQTRAVFQAAINNLTDAMRELDSLAGVEVLHDEGADIAEGD